MKSKFFDYSIQPESIAQSPLAARSSCRLLNINSKHDIEDKLFSDLPAILNENDLLILNNTKVIKARLRGFKEVGGGSIEIFIERLISSHRCLAQIRASKSPKVGTHLLTKKGVRFVIKQRIGVFYDLLLRSDDDLELVLEHEGDVPLPPYIRRETEPMDEINYQTIYATMPGAVAAPTAGLHFDDDLFDALIRKKISVEYITLHVGAATFQPIREEYIEDHRMHSEWICVEDQVIKSIRQTKKRGGRIIAVGTTVVRALESAHRNGALKSMTGYTDLYIVPGFRFNVVDALITNFHQPMSSLFVLVSAFAGLEEIRKVYSHALTSGYRFFSYGDAMFIGNNGA